MDYAKLLMSLIAYMLFAACIFAVYCQLFVWSWNYGLTKVVDPQAMGIRSDISWSDALFFCLFLSTIGSLLFGSSANKIMCNYMKPEPTPMKMAY